MKTTLAAWIVCLGIAVVGCQHSNPATAEANGESTTKDQAAAAPAIPSNLQNDAYHYLGLNRTEPMTYVVSTLAPGAKDPAVDSGGEVVKFHGMENGKAKFSIDRTGALESLLGSDTILLDDKGATIASSDSGTVDGNPIDLPATIKAGDSWKTDYSVKLNKSNQLPNGGTSEDHSTFKVVGQQQVKTKLGTFDAMLVESEGNDTLNDQHLTLKTQSWYVKDRGPVKILVTTIAGGQTTTLTIEAAPGDPK